jgi:putative two-component system response regulator
MNSVGIVDDNPTVLGQMRLMLSRAGFRDVRTCSSAREALQAFTQAPPSVLLIDYLMPDIDGLQLLGLLQDAGAVRHTPVAMISGCADLGHLRVPAFRAGAHEVLAKPLHPEEFALLVRNLSRLSTAMAQGPGSTTAGFQPLYVPRQRVPSAAKVDGRPHERLVHRLFDKLGAFRDECVGRRATRLAQYAATIAQHHGLNRLQQDQLLAAAPLHDIGCIGVPDEVLFKQGALTEGERGQFERHTIVGYELLREESTPLLKLAAEIALTHHERWDGNGYPMGLVGEDVPLSGRIVAVADALEERLSGTVGGSEAVFTAAIQAVAAGASTRFDPAVVHALRAAAPALRRIHDHFENHDGAAPLTG